jgi:hypothetical protein
MATSIENAATSPFGPTRTSRDVRYRAAPEGQADIKCDRFDRVDFEHTV